MTTAGSVRHRRDHGQSRPVRHVYEAASQRSDRPCRHGMVAARAAGAAREAHERAGAREGIAGYQITSILPDGTRVPTPDRDEYFPIFYGATGPHDSPAFGLDINDGGLRQRALETARDEDRSAASSNFSLRGNRVGFLMVAPVYRPGVPHATVPERRENLIGFVHGLRRNQLPARKHHQHCQQYRVSISTSSRPPAAT